VSRDLGWRADGIERAMAVGGVVLETYHRPGFTGGKAVRRAEQGGAGTAGIELDPLPDAEDDD
jgi:hypothetical protein